MDKDKILKAGKIAKEVKEYARKLIKKDMPLLEIVNKIESKIEELEGKPAFPCTLSINEVAAHYTPSHDDETKAHGLLKVDFGVHIDGWAADNAFTLDLENSEENKKIIEAAEIALEKVTNEVKAGKTTSEIGKIIEGTIESKNMNPIINLCGHSMDSYDLHSGFTIPNIDDKKNLEIKPGLYAIEPFATPGSGRVHEGKPSNIYVITEPKNTRSQIAREVLEYIIDNYQTLPFCSRWIVKKFETKGLIALKQLEEQGILHHFPQLIESSKEKVAQAENTFLIEKDQTIVTTE
tara:strand:+ start:1995 stop:2873 length:879 start_codon:yes stop_codon:yes gene_type:complete